ncbi:MAG: aminotransferase class III-fold pyridoxal phosphate-dependent enzyme, partial [Myxococcota bacterium]|nr:aminotransferase class III-fold pyridoxal phosphate-dependent enzyme [Myxococcota bacterium]
MRVTDCESMNIELLRRLYKAHVNPLLDMTIDSFGTDAVMVDHAQGVWITARDGRRILDAAGSMSGLAIGHNHPRILAARERYLDTGRMEVHKTFYNPWLAALSHNVASVLPADLDYPFFCNSGAEAAEGALKLAFKYHGGTRATVLHADIGAHGDLLGARSVSGARAGQLDYPRLDDTDSFAYGDIDSVSEALDRHRDSRGRSDVYALIIEPLSTSTFAHCDGTFLEALRTLCTRDDVILIFDEGGTGWCRTGAWLYFMHHDTTPDVVTVSKALGGGKASISAYVARAPVLDKAYGRVRDVTLHSTTYNGFGEECVTALETIALMSDEDFVGKARRLSDRMALRGAALSERFSEQLADVVGFGTTQGLIVRAPGSALHPHRAPAPRPGGRRRPHGTVDSRCHRQLVDVRARRPRRVRQRDADLGGPVAGPRHDRRGARSRLRRGGGDLRARGGACPHALRQPHPVQACGSVTRQRITTWDGVTSAMAEVVRPEDEAAVCEALANAGDRALQVCVRGGGFSIGDVAILDGGVVLDMTAMAGVRHFDPETGELTCGAGTRIADLLLLTLPAGWRTVGMSGSAFDTIGGALASNTHGRDTWWAGHFAQNVVGFRMVTADGGVLEVDRESDAELFHAVTGALGMLGVVVEVRLQLTAATSIAVETESERYPTFGALADALRDMDPSSGLICHAEVDPQRRGKPMGSAMLQRTRFMDHRREDDAAALAESFRPRARILGLPEETFWSLTGKLWTPKSFKLARQLRRRTLWAEGSVRRSLFPQYWYPQLSVPHFNRLFTPDGPLELHAFAPWDQAVQAYELLLDTLARAGRAPWLCMVRRLRASPSPLTFSGEGPTMTTVIDQNGLTPSTRQELLERYADVLLTHGGRLYLTKSPWASPAATAQMYPRAAEVLTHKKRLDPNGLLASDATRRLFGTTGS